MKQLLFLLLAVTLLHTAGAQTLANPYPRTITVSGSAEMEIIPDEIYVQVDLREYDKKGDKTPIDKIKNAFLQNLRNLGIPDSLISIASYEGYNGYQWWWKKRKKELELMASISYQIKLKDAYKIDQIVNILDDDATQNFQIVRTSHSRITEFRKQLKIQAVKAAKDKALYLTEAISEKAGEAISINEPADVSVYYFTPRGYTEANKYANVATAGTTAPDQAAIDFKKIKLKFDVNVVFALK
jgi:uncharacterized protein